MTTYLEDHVAVQRVIDGGDRIAVVGRGHGTIKATDRRFDVPVMHLHDGVVERLGAVPGCGECRRHLFAPDARLELVERVHNSR